MEIEDRMSEVKLEGRCASRKSLMVYGKVEWKGEKKRVEGSMLERGNDGVCGLNVEK